MGIVLFYEPKLDRRAFVTEFLPEGAVHVTAVTPVNEFGAAAKNFKGRDRIVIFLDNIVKLRRPVLEPGWRVLVDGHA